MCDCFYVILRRSSPLGHAVRDACEGDVMHIWVVLALFGMPVVSWRSSRRAVFMHIYVVVASAEMFFDRRM